MVRCTADSGCHVSRASCMAMITTLPGSTGPNPKRDYLFVSNPVRYLLYICFFCIYLVTITPLKEKMKSLRGDNYNENLEKPKRKIVKWIGGSFISTLQLQSRDGEIKSTLGCRNKS
jgi:hypothetical protein